MHDHERDLVDAPMPLDVTNERLQGYALGCLEGGCGMLAGAAVLLALIVLAILFA